VRILDAAPIFSLIFAECDAEYGCFSLPIAFLTVSPEKPSFFFNPPVPVDA
jgi:hypothetical protein